LRASVLHQCVFGEQVAERLEVVALVARIERERYGFEPNSNMLSESDQDLREKRQIRKGIGR
jgi:hypothetical protein